MPAKLPTEDTTDKQVRNFGIGTYDSPSDSECNESEEADVQREAIPPVVKSRVTPIDGELIMSPDYAPSALSPRQGSGALPGDNDRPIRGRRPEQSVIDTVVPSVAEAKLPHDEKNPPARSDYYDKTKVGETMLPGERKNEKSLDNFLGSLGNWWSGWEVEDSAQPLYGEARDVRQDTEPDALDGGTFKMSVKTSSHSPPTKRQIESWDPYETGYSLAGHMARAWELDGGEDGPRVQEQKEKEQSIRRAYDKYDPEKGEIVWNTYAHELKQFMTEAALKKHNLQRSKNWPKGNLTRGLEASMNTRKATNLELVGTLTTDFIKKYGKKDITRRHVMAFLKESGYHQYLASDVVRCLKLRHDVHMADVLDQFPTSTKKTASVNIASGLTNIRYRLMRIGTSDSNVAVVLRNHIDALSEAIHAVERF